MTPSPLVTCQCRDLISKSCYRSAALHPVCPVPPVLRAQVPGPGVKVLARGPPRRGEAVPAPGHGLGQHCVRLRHPPGPGPGLAGQEATRGRWRGRGCGEEQEVGEEQVLRPDSAGAAVENNRAGTENLLRTFRGGSHGPGQKGHQDGTVQGVWLHPIL